MEKNTKEMVLYLGVIVGCLVLLTAVLVPLLYFNSINNKPAEYSILDGVLRISGEYGEEIKLTDIVRITTKQQIPEIQQKIKGYASGNTERGYFKLKDIGQTKLLVESEKPPFIFINVKSGLLILNISGSNYTT